jgi:hypothetical protein
MAAGGETVNEILNDTGGLVAFPIERKKNHRQALFACVLVFILRFRGF